LYLVFLDHFFSFPLNIMRRSSPVFSRKKRFDYMRNLKVDCLLAENFSCLFCAILKLTVCAGYMQFYRIAKVFVVRGKYGCL
jgi:hypothetical protein